MSHTVTGQLLNNLGILGKYLDFLKEKLSFLLIFCEFSRIIRTFSFLFRTFEHSGFAELESITNTQIKP